MTYPNNIDYFVAKIDKNASGWYVSGENFNVPSSPYNLFLDHVPKDSATTTILPSGGGTAWTEDFTGSPAAGEYYVNYDVGKLTFNSADVGTSLEAQYQTLGDDIMAEHVNTLQLSASGVENELGLGCRGSYDNVSQRLDSFMTIGSSIDASQVNIMTPPGLSATTVQEFIDASGTANRSDTNPFGIGWDDIYNADGDMVRAQNNITTGYLFANTISASGNQIGINVDGPDSDSWMYFFDAGSPIGQWLKWDDGDNRFEFSGDLWVQGNINASGVSVTPQPSGSNTSIQYNNSGYFGGDLDLTWDGSTLTTNNVTASGNIMPDASGANSIGTAAVSWGAGYFDNLEAATSIYANTYYGDGSNLTGVTTTTTFIDLTDTPAAYAGFTASGVRVNGAGTGLEFCDLSGAGGGGTSDHDLLNNLAWSVAGHTIDANVIPTASGTQAVGTAAVAFNEGHFNNLYANYFYGDASYLTNVPTPGGGYVHIQSSPSVAWSVNHNLGTDDVIVQVADNSSPPLQVIPTEIEYTNSNLVTVTFSEAKAGQAMVVLASGAPGGGGGATTFLALSDTPFGYAGFAASGVRVNSGQTGLEFYDASTGGGGTSVHSSLTNLEWSVAGHTINTDFLPAASGTYDIGSAALPFSELYVSTIYVNSDVTPQSSGIFDIGSESNTYNNIYAETVYADDYFETSDTGIFYWGDPNTDGTWRFTRQGDNLVAQRRESGTWVTKSTFTP